MRALIVDDELHAREALDALLQANPAFTVVGSSGDAVSALRAIRSTRPDVVFLDIDMPAISGFELLSMIEDAELPRVVFVTAHDEYAVRAFEENAVDYLLKPVSRERLEKTAERLRQRPAGPGPAVELRAAVTRVPCLSGKAIRLVHVSEIEFARSSEAGVYVVCAAGEFLTDLTLGVLEERVGLVRCHKQYVVGLDHIEEVLLGEGATTLRTRTGKEVPVSRRLLPAIRERLGI